MEETAAHVSLKKYYIPYFYRQPLWALRLTHLSPWPKLAEGLGLAFSLKVQVVLENSNHWAATVSTAQAMGSAHSQTTAIEAHGACLGEQVQALYGGVALAEGTISGLAIPSQGDASQRQSHGNPSSSSQTHVT